MAFFSIIVPCYNLKTWIRDCLNSVLAQSFTDWECIVIDDESTDGSGAILDEYAKRDSRFRIIHQKNAGEGGARNAGLEVARGEWVVFWDGDDVMLSGALDVLAKSCDADSNLVRFGFIEFDDGQLPNSHIGSCFETKQIDISEEIGMLEFYSYVWQHAYRKSVVHGIRFKRYKRGCDRVYIDDVLLNRVGTVKVIAATLYGYRKREGSAMSSIPSVQVLRDEMDHRLDIMEMIDTSGKKVEYAGNYWLEGYFIHAVPLLTLDRPDDAREIKIEWRNRLPRLVQCKGLSRKGRWKLCLASSWLFRPIGDFILYTLPCIRHKSPLFKSMARLYRRIMRHGEFAREK